MSTPLAPPSPRVRGPRSADADKQLAVAAKLGAPGGAVQNPCLEERDGACARTALEPLFRRFDALDDRTAKKHASLAVLGNSLIASDHIVDVVRARLQERFGDGGAGFLLADRMADYGPRTRTGRARPGAFRAHNFAMGQKGRYPFGVAGVLHVSRARGARTWWPVRDEARARVFWLDHEGAPPLALFADDALVEELTPSGDERMRVTDVVLPSGSERVALVARGPRAVVYGASLSNDAGVRPGVMLHTFGVPAAGPGHFLKRTRADLFREQLQALAPDLVVIMLGGNETKRLEWRQVGRRKVETHARELVARLRDVAPDAGCLVVGPIDAVKGKGARPWRTRPHLAWVNESWRWTAVEHGCAFFDLLGAMGGPGALKRFAQRGWVHDDLVHPRAPGLDVLGELLADALLDAYASTERPATTHVAVAR